MSLDFDPRQSEHPTPPKPLRTVDDQARMVRRIGLVVLAVIAIVLVWAFSTNNDDAATPTMTRLETADDAIANGWIDVGDDGRTMTIDGRGEQDPGASVTVIASVLALLDVPDSVVARMDSTRALDGVQEASWDGLTATWTYHPDNGLDIIITD